MSSPIYYFVDLNEKEKNLLNKIQDKRIVFVNSDKELDGIVGNSDVVFNRDDLPLYLYMDYNDYPLNVERNKNFVIVENYDSAKLIQKLGSNVVVLSNTENVSNNLSSIFEDLNDKSKIYTISENNKLLLPLMSNSSGVIGDDKMKFYASITDTPYAYANDMDSTIASLSLFEKVSVDKRSILELSNLLERTRYKRLELPNNCVEGSALNQYSVAVFCEREVKIENSDAFYFISSSKKPKIATSDPVVVNWNGKSSKKAIEGRFYDGVRMPKEWSFDRLIFDRPQNDMVDYIPLSLHKNEFIKFRKLKIGLDIDINENFMKNSRHDVSKYDGSNSGNGRYDLILVYSDAKIDSSSNGKYRYVVKNDMVKSDKYKNLSFNNYNPNCINIYDGIDLTFTDKTDRNIKVFNQFSELNIEELIKCIIDGDIPVMHVKHSKYEFGIFYETDDQLQNIKEKINDDNINSIWNELYLSIKNKYSWEYCNLVFDITMLSLV